MWSIRSFSFPFPLRGPELFLSSRREATYVRQFRDGEKIRTSSGAQSKHQRLFSLPRPHENKGKVKKEKVNVERERWSAGDIDHAFPRNFISTVDEIRMPRWVSGTTQSMRKIGYFQRLTRVGKCTRDRSKLYSCVGISLRFCPTKNKEIKNSLEIYRRCERPVPFFFLSNPPFNLRPRNIHRDFNQPFTQRLRVGSEDRTKASSLADLFFILIHRHEIRNL